MTNEHEETIKTLRKFSQDLVVENADLKQLLFQKDEEIKDKNKKIYKLENRGKTNESK